MATKAPSTIVHKDETVRLINPMYETLGEVGELVEERAHLDTYGVYTILVGDRRYRNEGYLRRP